MTMCDISFFRILRGIRHQSRSSPKHGCQLISQVVGAKEWEESRVKPKSPMERSRHEETTFILAEKGVLAASTAGAAIGEFLHVVKPGQFELQRKSRTRNTKNLDLRET